MSSTSSRSSLRSWERRRSFRIPITGKALLQTSGKLEGLYDVTDLSIGGCMLAGRYCPPLGRKFDVALHVEGELAIELPAKVVRATQHSQSTDVGLRFMDPGPAVEDRIQDLTLRALESEPNDEILVVHAHPESVTPLLEGMRGARQRIVAARTARDAMALLESAATHIRVALVAPMVGTSRAHDIIRLILQRFPNVDCVLLSKTGVDRLGRVLRDVAPKHEGAWSLSRLRRAIAVPRAIPKTSA